MFVTPGPVWVAILARSLSSGFHGAWPLALGVVVGDLIWPLVAILGMSWVVSAYSEIMIVLKYVAMAMFCYWGLKLIKTARAPLGEDRRPTKKGIYAGFSAGVAVIMSNPKAILFYMGILPGFFDLRSLTMIDIAVILLISASVPFLGNLLLSVMVIKVREFLSTPRALYRLNLSCGIMLILVGISIGFL